MKYVQKLFVCLLSLVMAATPLAAKADLGKVLDAVTGDAAVNVNAPGRFNSQARSSIVLGGFELRAAPTRNTPTLVSFTPPSLNFGCSGVSMFFGGFSFISGEQFEQLLKNISSGVALGFVAHLALKTLCPQCEAVVQLMQRLNQIASMASRDMCKYGAMMAQRAFPNGLFGSPSPDAKSSGCAMRASGMGFIDDMLSGLETACKSVQAASDFLQKNIIDEMEKLSKAGVPEDKVRAAGEQKQLSEGLGNKTWLMSKQYFREEDAQTRLTRHFIMNAFGTVMSPPGTASGPSRTVSCSNSRALNEKGDLWCPPQMGSAEILDLFMCGIPAAAVGGSGEAAPAESLRKHCQKSVGWDTGDILKKRIYICRDQSAISECLDLDAVPLLESPLFDGYRGLLFQVSSTLRSAVLRVQTNQKLYSGPGDEVGRRIVGLIQASPFPLYQAINASAVYPAAAVEVLDSMTILLAEQLAISYFEEIFRLSGRTSMPSEAAPEMLRSFTDTMSAFSNRVEAVRGRTATNIAVQEGIAQSIRSLNQAIQRQVMTEDLLGSNRFGQGLAGLVNSGGGRSAGAAN